MTKTLIILCAGSGTRMGENKMLMRIAGKTPVELCIRAGEKSCADKIVLAVSADTYSHAEETPCSKPKKLVYGGKTRGESVYKALLECDDGIVAIHDGARCAVSPQLIDRCFADAVKYGNSTAAVPMRDTVRVASSGLCLDRDGLYIMQTPQVFRRDEILAAYEKQGTDTATDDCGVFCANGGKLHYTISDITNQKLTSREDIAFFEKICKGESVMRIGYGEDTHRLCENRDLILGGVKIDYRLGLLGHSDADVLCHAISDAILGACALGDIGKHFPDTDKRYEGADSLMLLHEVVRMAENVGYTVGNIDSTIIAQEPKLSPYILSMRENISRVINTDINNVSVKATTPEHTNAEGRLECITVRAVAMMIKK